MSEASVQRAQIGACPPIEGMRERACARVKIENSCRSAVCCPCPICVGEAAYKSEIVLVRDRVSGDSVVRAIRLFDLVEVGPWHSSVLVPGAC